MATSQVILPGQVIPNLWGVSQTLMEGLTVLGPLSCPASWPASLVKWITAEPISKTAPAGLTTPVKRDVSEPGEGKSHSGSSGKKPVPAKITDYWDEEERKREEEESALRREEKHRKKSTGPILSVAEHEEPISALVAKHTPKQRSQVPGSSTHNPSEGKRSRSKTNPPCPVKPDSSDDEPLSDKMDEPEPKSHKKETTPDLMIVDEDDEPLPGRLKGMGKKEKSRPLTQEELDGHDDLVK